MTGILTSITGVITSMGIFIKCIKYTDSHWYNDKHNDRQTDRHLYKAGVKYQKNYGRLKKAELGLNFLYQCKDIEVCLKCLS